MIRHALAGSLQAVLDEYAHVLEESLTDVATASNSPRLSYSPSGDGVGPKSSAPPPRIISDQADASGIFLH